jgi:hypothetical protein
MERRAAPSGRRPPNLVDAGARGAQDRGVRERLERQARNEALVREVNERIDALDREAETSGATPSGATFRFHCECGRDGGCEEIVWMTIAEYDAVRREDDRFALAAGHQNDELERVVERTDRFVVVDKVAAAEPFVADDPRGRPSR